jgi:hypothetical protein
MAGADLSPVNALPETASLMVIGNRATADLGSIGINWNGKVEKLSVKAEKFCEQVRRTDSDPFIVARFVGQCELAENVWLIDTPGSSEANFLGHFATLVMVWITVFVPTLGYGWH